MKVTKLGWPQPILTSGIGLNAGGRLPPGGNDLQVLTSNGSNGRYWGENVRRITSNGSNTLLSPDVNFASGSNITFAISSNTLTIHGQAGGGSSGVTGITSNGSNSLLNVVNLAAGTGIALGVSGQTITITNTGVPGPSGSGGGSGGFALDRSSLNATYGDHFTGSSLAAKWTRHNQGSGEETHQAGPGATHLRVAYSTATADRYIYQTAPNGTNETWEAAFQSWQATGTNQMFGILMLTTAGTGVAAMLYDNATGLYLANIVSHVFSSTLATVAYPVDEHRVGQRVWLRLRKASGAYFASWSFNGQIYSPEVTGTPTAFTPTRIGIGRFLGTDANDVLDIDWFDKSA